MQLQIDDYYQVIGEADLSEEGLASLTCLYQPLLGTSALAFYLTLHAEAQHALGAASHRHLGILLNLSAPEMEKARIPLEEYMLLKTYVRPQDQRHLYVYRLFSPLKPDVFLANRPLYTLYKQTVGEEEAQAALGPMRSEKELRGRGFAEVTHPVVHVDALARPQAEKEVNLQTSLDPVIQFDYERFLAGTSELVFPVSLRTPENMRLIGQLATVSGISPDRMRILVGNAVDVFAETLDTQKLRTLCEKETPAAEAVSDPYQLPPASFLQSRMNGARVPLADRRLLDHLAFDFHFSNEVINVLVAYVLQVSDNKLVPKFVDMVAGEWARAGVKTEADAKARVRKARPARRSRPEIVPSYEKERQAEKKNEELSAQQLAALQQQLQEAGKKKK